MIYLRIWINAYNIIVEQKNATCCKNLSQGGFKMEIHKDFYFEAVLNGYLRKDNMDVFVTGRSS